VIELRLQGREAFIDHGDLLTADFEASNAQFEFDGLRQLGNVLVRSVPDEFERTATVRRQRETIVNGHFRFVTSSKCRGGFSVDVEIMTHDNMARIARGYFTE